MLLQLKTYWCEVFKIRTSSLLKIFLLIALVDILFSSAEQFVQYLVEHLCKYFLELGYCCSFLFIYFLLWLSFCSVEQNDLCNSGRGYMYYG